uniref:Large ribosomal subunit protein uL5 n=2 Tax=environmental samples TaxID=1645731 RepID=A0A0H4TSE7_9BACT|nr:50S ribosomal protein L5, large subunit ribosomal protein L5 [uncultured Ignavibacteria bacterium Rifle_16ft_4_minimus_38491]AKQ05476.1 50S ribosomal protein L5, large subunit ribosomal protein L5 [uncultured Ignavibacteria bacterium Rifle_16ft_4_minimus_332]
MVDKKAKKENPEKQVKAVKESKDSKKESKKAQAPKEKELKIKTRLADYYKAEIVPSLIKKFSFKSVMQVPRLHKIVVNMGVGEAVTDQKILEEAIKDLETITGQKASMRKSKKAISNFKLREGVNIGAMVTLRKEKMYEFLDRLINIALPRVRDFKGLSDKSFDGHGNYSLGIKEQIIFPEINFDKVTRVLGMDITFVTSAPTDNEAYELLQAFGVPFRKKEIKSA